MQLEAHAGLGVEEMGVKKENKSDYPLAPPGPSLFSRAAIPLSTGCTKPPKSLDSPSLLLCILVIKGSAPKSFLPGVGLGLGLIWAGII